MNDTSLVILVVDSSPDDANGLETIIAQGQKTTFRLETVGQLSEAITRLEDGGVDIILANLSLPDSQGLDTLKRLLDRSPEVPIVVLAASEDEEMALRAVRAGAQDYVVKTQDSAGAIRQAVRDALERVRSRRHVRQGQEHLRLLAEQLPCVFWTTDTHQRFTSFAGAPFEELGIDTVTIIGKTVAEHFPQEKNTEAFLDAHRDALGGGARTLEMHWRRRIYHVHVSPFRRQDGTVIGALGLAVDVTEQRLIDLELSYTRRMQAGLLPSASPQLEGFDIAGSAIPLAEAGGDYFDYFPLSDGTTGIVVCDVGGHGLAPALMMSHIRAYLRALALRDADPGRIVSMVNQFLCVDIKEDRLATLFFAKLDPETRTLRYANAGHQGYLLSPQGAAQLLEPTGIPLNVLDDSITQTSTAIALAPGDLVVLYTDGIVEGLDADGNQFEVEPMLNLVHSLRSKSAQEIVETLFDAVRAHCDSGHIGDDITTVIIKVLTPSP